MSTVVLDRGAELADGRGERERTRKGLIGGFVLGISRPCRQCSAKCSRLSSPSESYPKPTMQCVLIRLVEMLEWQGRECWCLVYHFE